MRHAHAVPKDVFEGGQTSLNGAKGIDFGEMGHLLSEGAIRIAPDIGQFIEDWDTLLLAYANYKTDHGTDMCDLFREWGIDEHHHRWFNDCRSRLRIANFYAGIF